MKKIHKFILFIGFFLIGFLIFHFFYSPQTSEFSNGVNLDIARKFYGPQAIKNLIGQVAENGGSYIQLHLSDDENVAIELAILGQTEENAYVEKGTHYNNQTKRPFLTKEEVVDLVTYANDRGVELIADFDSPGHFRAAAELLRSYNPDLAQQVLVEDQLAYDKSDGLAFAKELYGEIADIFAGQEVMVIGGDEFDGDQTTSNPAYVDYVNEISSYLAEKSFVTRIWNDTVLKKDLADLDKENLQIIYWSLNGDANDVDSDWDQEANDYRIKNRATLPELQEAGFQVINANSYHLYSVPNQSSLADLEQAVEEEAKGSLNSWQPTLWNGTDHPSEDEPLNQASAKNLVGSLYSIWGEDLDSLADVDTIQSYQPALEKFFERAE